MTERQLLKGIFAGVIILAIKVVWPSFFTWVFFISIMLIMNPMLWLVVAVLFVVARLLIRYQRSRRIAPPVNPVFVNIDGRLYEEIRAPGALLKRYRPIDNKARP